MGIIKLKFFLSPSSISSQARTELELPLDAPKTIQQVLREAIEAYPELEGVIFSEETDLLNQQAVILHNGLVIRDNELAKRVQHGDVIVILPILAGG